MSYLVEVEHRFRAVQGLPSPVRAERGLSRLASGEGVEVIVRVAVAFEDEQLTPRGWFFDTDAAAAELAECCAELEGRPWTEVFEFRPTFELVARHLHARLAARLPQLAYVEIRDVDFGVTTRYVPPPRHRTGIR
ncbi:6-carboxytetrahydropterin synthase [Paractinoplanes ovalisporus]|uniref:6-carboxytetrahydropterin synthase n=1 Tax=Paractinoplanes ovalisporus TaxID=2810368 RepID=UPI0027DE0051|nr:6-carboxytetrahydropterin synthase [Actinoplanes ovalisporus]